MKSKIFALLFLILVPVCGMADDTNAPTTNTTDTVTTGAVATLSYQDILNMERDDTPCATAAFSKALERNATTDLETANEADIENWIRASFSEKQTIVDVLNCPEVANAPETETIMFQPATYTFPGGREIKVQYQTQPKIFRQRLALANRRDLPPATPSVDIMNDNENVWTNTEPAWYAIMVTRHGALDNFVGPDKNNTISLDYIAAHVHQMHPKNDDCTGETALHRDFEATQDALLTRTIRKHVSGFEGDKNDYYVPTDQDLSWIGWAQVALDVVITVATFGGSLLLRGGISAAQAAQVITKLTPVVKALEKSTDVIKYLDRVKDLDRANDALKAMDRGSDVYKQTRQHIKTLEKEIKSMDKIADVKKYKQSVDALRAAEKIQDAYAVLKNTPKMKQLRLKMTKLPDTIKDLEKSKDVAKYLGKQRNLDNINDTINAAEAAVDAKKMRITELQDEIADLTKQLDNPKLTSTQRNRITDQIQHKERGQGSDNIRALQDSINNSNKRITELSDEADGLMDEIADLSKTDDVVKYTETMDDLADTRRIMDSYRALGGLGKLDQTGNVLTRAFKTGRTLRAAYRTLKTANKTLSGASRVARSSVRSGRMRDFLYHSSRRNLKALVKMTGQTTMFFTTLETIGDAMYGITDASTSEFTNGVEFMPMLLLSADELKDQEDVVNYGMWLMWSGSSTSPTDDDAAYLQAMDYASRVHLALMQDQNGGNYPCNVDIWVVRPIIRNPDSDNPELYYLIMNDTPWTTAQ